MGIKERREREKAQRSNDILDAAEKVFFSRGMEKATMDEVAEVAELSKGTLYLYFKSKEDLYLGVILRAMEVLKSLFIEALKVDGPGIEKVEAIGHAYYTYFREYPDYFNASLYFEQSELDIEDEENPLAARCSDLHDAIFELVIQALEIGIADGSIRKDIDARNVAYVLWGQCTGMLQIAFMKGEHLQKRHGIGPDMLVTASFELIRQALAR